MISTVICRWLFLLISLSTWTKLIDAKEMRIVCYYTNWSVYRPGQAKFSPQNINPYLCTHLVYAFGGFTKENTLKPFDKYQDIEKGGYAKFTGLKTYNKNLKTLIAIGGWNEGSSRFSPMVASAERRKELVKNAIKFLRQNHFDGLDLDWEYPTFRDGGKPRDRDNYAQLVQELREEFERESEKTGRPRLLLTMAVPAGIEYINKGYDVPKLTKYLDWMNILSYDYHSAFEPAVNHHAPLYSLEEDNEYNYDAELNIDYTIKHYLKMGADPAKLVLGIPTYGRSYTLFNPDAFEIGSPADGPGDMGEATRENGYLAYYEICDYVKNQDWEVDEPNPKAMGPIAFKDNQWVGYDDENIVRKKAEYVVENGLGGIMFWAIDNDDFRGNCHGKPYPLIEAGKEAMLNAYGTNEDNLILPPSKPTKTSKLKNRRKTTTTTEKPEEVSVSTTPRRRRIKTKSQDKKSEETSTYSSLKIVTPAYTTPEPPATPDMGGAFKCEDEGFFPHPKDCKKYYWCLSGAGDSGIVAHQFTCPAGLYFNKAADSCDYSQNVFCNKKAQKATTEKTPATTTTRPPPKITAATSKTTLNFRTTTTTTTEAPEEEEYEYEEEEPSKKISAEEDPKVIKELIDLIRKAGGIEELEKQLNLGKDTTTSNQGSTTPSSISKSLFERVLSKTNKNSWSALRSAGNRNSGGPQGGFSEEIKEKKVERGRPQYRTLTRQRSTTETPAPTEPREKETKSRTSLEYVNIRRPKTSSTTEANEDDNGLSRNKILGELEAEENRDVEESEPVTKKPNQPQYVNIRRQRPTTTEATSTSSRYTSLRRSTASPVDLEDETELNEPSNTEAPSSTSPSLRYQTIRRGSTTTTTTASPETTRRRLTTTPPEDITTLRVTTSEATTDLVTTVDPEEIVKTDITSTQNTVTESNSSTVAPEAKKKRPLYQPRPFSAVATTTAATSTTTKVSPSFRTRARSSTEPTTTTTTIKARTRSRFSTVNRNLSGDVEQEEKYSRTLESTKPARTRKRLLTTTEKPLTDSNDDYNRAYRPTGELSDLSSLTAVDLNLRGGEFVSQQRRRRPGVVTTTTTATPKTGNLVRRVVIRGGPTTENTTQTSTRPRKIIRKFRPTGLSTTTTTAETPRSTRRVALFRQRTTPPPSDSDSSLLQLLKPRNTTTTEESNVEQPQEEEEENIKLSESNIRESSKINAFGLEEKALKKVFSGKSLLKAPLETTTTTTTTTTPARRVRTRKIIRKLITTSTEPVTETTTTTPTRRRKVFVRRRPANNLQSTTTTTTTTTEPPESTTSKSETTTRPYRLSLYTRPSYVISSPEPVVEEPEDEEVDEEEEDEEEEEDDPFMDDPYMDSYFKNLQEDEPHEEDNLRSTPSYTVYSFKRTHQFESSMNFNDDEDPGKENKTVSKVILTTSMNKKPETSTVTSLDEEGTTLDDVTLTSNEIGEEESTTLASSTTEYQRRSTLRSVKDRPRLGLNRRVSVAQPSTTTTSERSFKNRKFPSETTTATTPLGNLIQQYSTSETTSEPTTPRTKPVFLQKTTTTTTSVDDLGVDTEAVKTRNRNLFFKRKPPVTTTAAPVLEESTTDSLTTLHHIFAEISSEDEELDTTTEAMVSSPLPANTGKLERLIEVNRIVEIKTKQAKKKSKSGTEEVDTKVEIVPTVNKIGEISRITFIKIVDGDNETVIVKDPESNEISTSNDLLVTQEARVVEVPSKTQTVNLNNFDFDLKLPNREERKFEPSGHPKNNFFEIIDETSNVNLITPKPQHTETSTIPLQGLFNSEKQHLNPSFTTNDEVLETGRSEFVNVRLLDQDKEEGNLQGSTRFIPVRVLNQDEEVKAHVMEITPPDSRTIKIAPIQVEMARSVASFRIPPKS